MADDLTGVPTADWARVQSELQTHRAVMMLLWVAFVVLVVVLARKGILAWPDAMAGPGG